jgi:hypothetical protein
MQRRKREEERSRQAQRDQNIETARQRQQVEDAELIASAPGFPGPAYEMEMQRRLKVAITDLTGEIVTFRESSDRTGNRVMWLTAGVVVLTVVLVALTVVLAVKK